MSVRPPDLSTRAVSAFLLDLHAQANELGYRDMQRFALQRLAEVVPIDAGLFAVGTIRHGIPHGHDVMLHNRPAALMESWERVKHEDRVALEAMANPGQTIYHAVEDPIFDGLEAMRAHCRAWNIGHVMCTGQIDSSTGLYWVVSVFREFEARRFDESERATKELIAPHLFAAARQARLGQMRAATRVADAHGQCAAVISDEGVVLEAEGGLAALLRLEWPRWAGPWLPTDLWAQLGASAASQVVRGKLVVRSDATAGVRLLHVRRALLADRLTSREREIAQAFSLGENYREIGERLGIAPNTVRRHLANIYEKLGVSSKVELDRMVSVLG
jgi:DNA-binding CsgD family transcriptional regulator